jgi:F0F1-type ATP synthase membrane subunit b/b'
MKPAHRKAFFRFVGWLVVLAFAAAPVLAAEGNSPEPADTLTGTIFRWLNFALVIGGLAYVIHKFGTPYFRAHAQSISNAIREASAVHAAAERELREAGEQLTALDAEVQELRRAAALESAAEAERIRMLARTETEKIGRAARAEIEAAERAAWQEVRSVAARLATERAAALVRARINAAADATLFRSFVGELERSVQ